MEEEASQIRLVAGLGNPGSEYRQTRHNIGFMVVDRLASILDVVWEKSGRESAVIAKFGQVLLAKPMTFMNRSGEPLLRIARYYKIDPAQMLVVLDDFSLPLGRLRIRADGGTGGHNGLESIIVQFGTDQIPRLRIGIGGASSEGAVDHVTRTLFRRGAAGCRIDNRSCGCRGKMRN